MISVYSAPPLVGPCPGGAAAGEFSEFDLRRQEGSHGVSAYHPPLS